MRISDKNYNIMMKQIELDCNLAQASEISKNIFLAPSKKIEGARIINNMDLFMKIIVFMGKAYIMADESILGGCEDFFRGQNAEWMFEFFNLRKIDYILHEFGRQIVDTHIFYLPDEDAIKEEQWGNEIWYNKKDIEQFRNNNPYHNAYGFSPTQPDYIGVGVTEDNIIKAMAGASIDGRYLRQIGIDVVNEYQGQGLASHLVSLLRQRILEDGNLPFYGTNESHAISRSVAIKSGFLPAFSEVFISQLKNAETTH